MSQNSVSIKLKVEGAEQAVKQVHALAGEMQQLGERSNKAVAQMGGWRERIADLAHAGTVFSLAASGASGFASSIASAMAPLISAQRAAEALSQSLAYSQGSAAAAASEIDYLRKTAQKLGLDFASSAKAYASFAAATKDTGITAEQTRTVFEGVAQASAKMGLSAEETEGALLALSQMAGKGVVSAEELRGQLGERLPGAFNLAAKAMGVSTQQLNKMLETGQIMASDFLPKFGAALKQEFIAPLSTLTQEINRVNSAWEVWKQSFASGNAVGFSALTNGINESSAAMRALGDEAGIVHRLLVAIGGLTLGAVGRSHFNLEGRKTELLQQIAALDNEIRAQESRGVGFYGRGALAADKDRLSELKRELDRIAFSRGKLDLPNLKEQFQAQQSAAAAASDQAVSAFESKFSTAVQKQQSKVLELTRAYASAYKAISDEDPGAGQKRADLLAQFNAALGEMELSGKKGATGTGAVAKEAARLAAEIDKVNAAWRESITADAGKIADEAARTTATMREQYETLGMTTAELAEYRAAKLDTAAAAEAHAAAELETAAVLLDLQGQLPEVARSYRELASARREAADNLSEQAQITRAGAEKQANQEAREASKQAADQAAADWKRASNAIEDALIDALMDGGKSGAEYVESLFRTMVLRPVVQALVQPVAGSITSAMGFGPTTGQGGSAGLNPASLIPGSAIGNAALWAGGALGTGTMLGGFAAGFGTAMVSGAGTLGTMSAGASLMGTAGGGAAGAGMIAGAALPWIGGALAIASMLGAFGGKPSDKTAWATYDPTRDGVTDVGSFAGKKDPGQEARDQTAALAQLVGSFGDLAGITSSITAMTGARDGMRLSIDREEGTLGFRTPQAGIANGGNALNYGNGEGVVERMLADLVDEGTLPQATIAAWRALRTDTLGAARDAGELVSTLNLLVAGYDEATIERANLLQMEGEALESALGRMLQIEQALDPDALSAQEQAAQALGREFERLGHEMPATAAELGALIEGLDLTTDAGRGTYRAMIGLAPAFLQVSQAAEAAAAEALAEAAGLQERIWQLTGDTTQLRLAELAELDPANWALQQHIWSLEEQAEASEIAADASREAADGLRELGDAGMRIRDYLRDLRTGGLSGAGPGESLSAAAAAYRADRAGARSNDPDALARIPGSADAYLRAALATASRASDYRAIVGTVTAELAALPAVKNADELLRDAVLAVNDSVSSYGASSVGWLSKINSGVGKLQLGITTTVDGTDVASGGGASIGGYAYSAVIDGKTYSVESATPWTAASYAAKNPEVVEYYTTNKDALREAGQGGTLAAYLDYHFRTWGIMEGRKFAAGAAFEHGIVSRPTAFDMGLMGEAGPEAIMPLRRAKNGSLGVIALPAEPYPADRSAPRNASPDLNRLVDELRRMHAEIRELHEELRLLRRDNNTANSDIAASVKKSARIAAKWDAAGLPATLEAAA